jgi:hypothetical protein
MSNQFLSKSPLPRPEAVSGCSANYCTTSSGSTWSSPNSLAPPFPLPDFPTLNVRRHASWWNSSSPWLPYIPVFGLHANAHHEFFSISKNGIVEAETVDGTWKINPVRIAQWQEFFISVHDICQELLRYSSILVNEGGVNCPPHLSYEDLLPLRMESAIEMEKILMITHDIMLEWIGYFNWLCVAQTSENDIVKSSTLFQIPRVSSFCCYLSKFSNMLRGVCIDFETHSISVDLVQQWVRYHVPCYIIVNKNGIEVGKIPFQYTIHGMAAQPKSPRSNKLHHYAIEQKTNHIKIWTPPKKARTNNMNKRNQYFNAFYSSDFQLYLGNVRVYWYKVRKDEFANQVKELNEIEQNRKDWKNPYRIFDKNYNSSEDSDHDPEPYLTSDDDTHQRHQAACITLAKLIRPALPPSFDFVRQTPSNHGNSHHVLVTVNPPPGPSTTYQLVGNNFNRPNTPPPDSPDFSPPLETKTSESQNLSNATNSHHPIGWEDVNHADGWIKYLSNMIEFGDSHVKTGESNTVNWGEPIDEQLTPNLLSNSSSTWNDKDVNVSRSQSFAPSISYTLI